MPPDKHLQAKCRNLLAEYSDVLEVVLRQVTEEVDREILTGDSSFDYAKKAIRIQGIKEGMKTFLAKINSHATKR